MASALVVVSTPDEAAPQRPSAGWHGCGGGGPILVAALLLLRVSLPGAAAAQPAPAEPMLQRLERLERELAASRQRVAAQQAELEAETARQRTLAEELAQMRRQLSGPAAATAPGAAPASAAAPAATAAKPAATAAPAAAPASGIAYRPGGGLTLQAGAAQLRLGAEARLLGFSSSRLVFNAGQPLVVSPKDAETSYDLSAQQSTVSATLLVPLARGWSLGGHALFTLQDNLLAEGTSFTPVVFYGQASQGPWTLAAGQNFDLFAPRDPDNLPSGKLAASGNPGAYRPQLRLEHRLGAEPGRFGGAVQLAVASPITTALPSSLNLADLPSQELVEDNGWPNLEGRLNLGFGTAQERAGGRRLRPLELGFSGVVGQLRVLDNIRATDPLVLVADRTTVPVWGAAFDGQLALGRRFTLRGELYTGQGLGEYMAGIFQTYNRSTNQPVATAGGWGQLGFQLTDTLRLHLGYGIDHAQDSGTFGLLRNSTAFANLIYDPLPWLQLGLEGNYKITRYDSFGDKNAWVVISEVLFRL